MRDILHEGKPSYCDFYHLTMAHAWFQDGKHNEFKKSEAFFRKNPFNGGYVLAAGLGEFLEWVENWKITDEDIAYMRKQKAGNGEPIFQENFLAFLKGMKLDVDVKAVPEGEVVFSNEPVVSINGPNWQVDMVETAFLNIFNSQSLIATKAARICQAACADGIQRPVMEFGLRRAQELGAFTSTRAAFIGGCIGTSNVAAAAYYDIPAVGTMAHSYVMSYADECEAFKAFLRASPNNATLLPDTYDTREGIKNAIRASRETGVPLKGCRIDSGDLAYEYKQARQLLDEAGMTDAKLIASNDLDEHIIENLIMVQRAKYDMFAAGTKLVTAYDCPALGGVYKNKEYLGEDKIKVAAGKTTIPGATNVVRIVNGGVYDGDIIVSDNFESVANGYLQRDIKSYKMQGLEKENTVFDKGSEAYMLLKPVVEKGRLISDDKDYSLREIQAKAKDSLSRLDEAYKRLVNPHLYGVGLEQKLFQNQQMMILKYQGRQAG